MMNQIFAVLLVLVPFVSSAHPADSLITQIDATTSVWISPNSIQHRYFLESTNRGNNWDTVRFNYTGESNYSTFSLDFNSPSPVLVLSDSNWIIPGFDGTFSYTGALLISKDRGRSWDYLQLDREIRSLGRFEVHFSDRNNGMLLSKVDVWNTADGGYTWKKNPIIKKEKDVYHFNLVFYDELVGVLRGRQLNQYTLDGGKTWLERIGGLNEPNADVSLQQALLTMRLDVLEKKMSTLYIYDKSNAKELKHAQLSIKQHTSGHTFDYVVNERSVFFLSGEITDIQIAHGLKEVVLELKNVAFKPGQIVVLSMDFENNQLELDAVSTQRINEMWKELRTNRSFEIMLLGFN